MQLWIEELPIRETRRARRTVHKGDRLPGRVDIRQPGDGLPHVIHGLRQQGILRRAVQGGNGGDLLRGKVEKRGGIGHRNQRHSCLLARQTGLQALKPLHAQPLAQLQCAQPLRRFLVWPAVGRGNSLLQSRHRNLAHCERRQDERGQQRQERKPLHFDYSKDRQEPAKRIPNCHLPVLRAALSTIRYGPGKAKCRQKPRSLPGADASSI